MSKIIIKNGRVFDPACNLDGKFDVLIEKGKIREIAPRIDNEEAYIINATGMFIFPGFIDAHAHLREPGQEYKETIESGAMAAIHGGVTTVFAMPNTTPPIDNRSLVEFIIKRSRDAEHAEVLPIGTITKQRKGQTLSEMGDMSEAGAIAFSDDGDWVANSAVMRRALEYSRFFNRRIISHAEDTSLSTGVVNESTLSYKMGLSGKPYVQEEIAVFRDIKLAEFTGGKLHIAHVSTQGSASLIKHAKESIIDVSCEVTPHHLLLSEEDIMNFSPIYKVNPPLRADRDRVALLDYLKDGTIDIIATDHAPHIFYEKETDFDTAPYGMISLDFYFPLLYTKLVLSGKISLTDLIRAVSNKPAELFGLNDRGVLKKGKSADIVIFDPNKKFILNKSFLKSKSYNTPFLGQRLQGVVKYVLKAGKLFTFGGDK